MQVEAAMKRLGGVATTRALLALTSRRRLHAAVRSGVVVRLASGRYALPTAEAGLVAAHRLSGVVSGLSAAAAQGWEVKHPPEQPSVTVPRNRKLAADRRVGVSVTWRDVPETDIQDGVLRPVATVVDCARTLPFDEALAVADSALRHGHVRRAQLVAAAEAVPTTGRRAALRVAREADGRAANPFESVLRAIALEVRGLTLEPQVTIRAPGFVGRPDLVDRRRRLVVEADSFGFHASRAALRRDCRRYTALTLLGWRVVRFAWEDVMFEAAYVRDCLDQLASVPVGRAAQRRTDRKTA